MSKPAGVAFLLISLASAAALPGGLDAPSFVEAAKRTSGVNYLGNQLPSCSDNDPSYAAPQTQYQDGQGQYVDWDCQKDSSGSQQCWYGPSPKSQTQGYR